MIAPRRNLFSVTKLLAIETSSEACSVACSVNGQSSERVYHEPRRHAELLLPAIRELLSEHGIALSELDAVAFGRGPGSFTSLRIGIGVVQGLAWGAGLGVVPVSSLAALAQGLVTLHDISPGTSVVVAMDARMDEVFHARYRVGESGLVELAGKEQVAPPSSVQFPGDEPYVYAGTGFGRYPELQASNPGMKVYEDQWPQAASVLKLGEDWLSDNEALPAHRAQPLYIRDDVAKKSADQ